MEARLRWLRNFVSVGGRSLRLNAHDDKQRSDHDQELDSLLVGPIPVGVNKFIFEADPPKLSQIPMSEILGVTVILLTCSYDGREFVRVGYYVNNEYDSEELNAEPPAKPLIERVRRNILAEKPRVTRFAIKWSVHSRPMHVCAACGLACLPASRDSEESAPAEFPPDQPEADTVDDDGDKYGAEEVELEQALIKEEAELAANMDEDMGGAEETAGPAAKEEEEESEAGSEDLEAESSGSDDDEGEDEEGEAQGDEDEDMEMGEGEDAQKPMEQQHEVMVH